MGIRIFFSRSHASVTRARVAHRFGLLYLLLSPVLVVSFSSCNFLEKLEERSQIINNYEKTALSLARQNRILRMELEDQKFEVQNINVKLNFCETRIKEKESLHEMLKNKFKSQVIGNNPKTAFDESPLDGKEWIRGKERKGKFPHHPGKKVRGPGGALNASHAPSKGPSKSRENWRKPGGNIEDRDISLDSASEFNEVKFDVYKWTGEELLSMALDFFKKKNYSMAAQYFHQLVKSYPDHKEISDSILLMASISFYESGQMTSKASNYLQRLITLYPNSKYYRSAKLWLGLTYLKLGRKNDFFQVVEEFRLKYKNSDEWTVLSKYYENFRLKYGS